KPLTRTRVGFRPYFLGRSRPNTARQSAGMAILEESVSGRGLHETWGIALSLIVVRGVRRWQGEAQFFQLFGTGHPFRSHTMSADVLCAGIIVADHVCTPISHVPAPGELVMADRLLLTLGGCAANTAVDLAKMGVGAAVVGRVGGDLFGRIVGDMLREARVDTGAMMVVPSADTS